MWGFDMPRQYFTMNPATPHPDDETEPQPMPLEEAIIWAAKVLRDQNATLWTRQKVADELIFSLDSQEPTE
jgi:hypothetical protein